MNDPFFTLSLSCCDVAPYLDECFDSILSQSFADWDCVVWVETSDDDTLAVVRRRTGNDPRFRVFTGPRTGSCSVSRNKGIELARGKYVLFVDGDDCFAPDALRRLRERIGEHPGMDVYAGATRYFLHETGETVRVLDNYPAGLDRELTGAEATFLRPDLWTISMLQLNAFRVGFLREGAFKCVVGLRGQDMEFFSRVLYRARRVLPVHEAFYNYRVRENSVTTSRKSRLDSFYDHHARIYRSLLSFYAEVSREPGFDRRVAAYWAKAWVSRQIAFEWFRPKALDGIPRARRVDALRALFADGFDAFDRLRREGGFKTRLVGLWIKVFVKHPRLRGFSELFFRTYAALNRLKAKAGRRPRA